MNRLGRKLLSGISLLTYLSQIFVTQASWAGGTSEETYFAPSDPRAIVTLVNAAGTPGNLIQAIELTVGPAAAKSLEKTFIQYGISLTDQIPKLELQNGTVLIADTQTPVLSIKGGSIPVLSTETASRTFDPKKSFEQNIESFKALLPLKWNSATSGFFGNFGIAEARADDADQAAGTQNATALESARKRKNLTRLALAAAGVIAVCVAVALTAPVSVPAILLLGTSAVVAGLVGGSALNARNKLRDTTPFFVCPSSQNPNLRFTTGGLTLFSNMENGTPKSIDVWANGKITSTYFVGNDWRVLGVQDPGKSAEVPMKRKLTDPEKVLVGNMKALASACSDPAKVAQMQKQLDQVQAQLRGTGGAPNSPRSGSAGHPS